VLIQLKLSPQNNGYYLVKSKVFCKKISAQIEAAAGSRLIKILNVRAGSWPSAFISNVKGMALDKGQVLL
jgi:hypothetical protein